jgi:peptide/nickel transport system permease protein
MIARGLTLFVVRIAIVLLVGGFLGATLVRIAPGFGVDEQEIDSRLSHESLQAIRLRNAGNENVAVYYLHYLNGLLHGDLGTSTTLQQPVRRLLVERFPETLKSVGLGLVLGWTLGLGLAVAPVMSKHWSVDFLSSFFAGVLLCLPAAMLALFFVISRAPGRLVVGLIVFPKVFSYARNLLKDSASQPHVLTAWAKGLGRLHILRQHILPVAAPQLIALAGVSVTIAFAAVIPVEAVCDLPGIGQLAWKAAMGRDLQLLVNLTMIITMVTLLANSASDFVSNRRGLSEA